MRSSRTSLPFLVAATSASHDGRHSRVSSPSPQVASGRHHDLRNDERSPDLSDSTISRCQKRLYREQGTTTSTTLRHIPMAFSAIAMPVDPQKSLDRAVVTGTWEPDQGSSFNNNGPSDCHSNCTFSAMHCRPCCHQCIESSHRNPLGNDKMQRKFCQAAFRYLKAHLIGEATTKIAPTSVSDPKTTASRRKPDLSGLLADEASPTRQADKLALTVTPAIEASIPSPKGF